MADIKSIRLKSDILRTKYVNKKIVSVFQNDKKFIYDKDLSEFSALFQDRIITDLKAEGIYFVIFLDNNTVIICDASEDAGCFDGNMSTSVNKDEIVFAMRFDDTNVLAFTKKDQMKVFHRSKQNWNINAPISALGDNIYSTNADSLFHVLHDNPGSIYSILSAGKAITGITSDTANDTLWIAKISPVKKVKSIHKKDWNDIVASAIQAVDGNRFMADNKIGSEKLKPSKGLKSPVNDRADQPCLRVKCSGKILSKVMNEKYTISYCKVCQK